MGGILGNDTENFLLFYAFCFVFRKNKGKDHMTMQFHLLNSLEMTKLGRGGQYSVVRGHLSSSGTGRLWRVSSVGDYPKFHLCVEDRDTGIIGDGGRDSIPPYP